MNKTMCLEAFQNNKLSKHYNWLNEPTEWDLKKDQLLIYTNKETDFWQKTHYGFTADNGHFLYREIDGDFTIEAELECDFKHQYDQAGLMIRVSEKCWVKSSVEYEPDKPNKLGVVVTNNGFSDWSTQDVSDSFINFKLKIVRKNSNYTVFYYEVKEQRWIQLRLFQLFDNSTVKVGLYACSPNQKSFSCAFNYLRIT